MLNDKQACEAEAQIHMIIWKGFKKGQSMWNKPNKQHKEFGLGFLDNCLRTQLEACVLNI